MRFIGFKSCYEKLLENKLMITLLKTLFAALAAFRKPMLVAHGDRPPGFAL
jgi:hypothetical protein